MPCKFFYVSITTAYRRCLLRCLLHKGAFNDSGQLVHFIVLFYTTLLLGSLYPINKLARHGHCLHECLLGLDGIDW